MPRKAAKLQTVGGVARACDEGDEAPWRPMTHLGTHPLDAVRAHVAQTSAASAQADFGHVGMARDREGVGGRRARTNGSESRSPCARAACDAWACQRRPRDLGFKSLVWWVRIPHKQLGMIPPCLCVWPVVGAMRRCPLPPCEVRHAGLARQTGPAATLRCRAWPQTRMHRRMPERERERASVPSHGSSSLWPGHCSIIGLGWCRLTALVSRSLSIGDEPRPSPEQSCEGAGCCCSRLLRGVCRSRVARSRG